MVMLTRPVQHPKAQSSIVVMKFGMTKFVRPIHSSKALILIKVTESGMVTERRLLQFQKANPSIEVTGIALIEFGITMEKCVLESDLKISVAIIPPFVLIVRRSVVI